MITLPYLSVARFSGTDAGEFLHNQVSNDVQGLDDGESVFACYCEPKGRVLALLLVCRVDDGFYVVMASALAKAVTDRMRMFVLRSQVEIELLDQCAIVGVIEETVPNATELATILPVPGTERSLLLLDAKTVADADESTVDAWKAAELRSGICWLDFATSGEFLPQWLGFDELGAVNFRKGCYPGQEIVARTRYLGKVKRHPRLLRLEMSTCPSHMAKLELTGGGETADAVAVDCVATGPDETLLFVVTRMDPDTKVENVDLPD